MSCLSQRPLAIRTTVRAFSSSARQPVGLHLSANDAELVKDTVPEWPYGPTRLYKQASRGLYGGLKVLYGNNTAEENKTKTRRTWHPNVRVSSLYSKALDRTIQLKVTARVIRTIDKVGGLDEYLLGEKESRIKELGETGWWLRWAIMQTPSIRERYNAQRAELGLPQMEQPKPPRRHIYQRVTLKKDKVIQRIEHAEARHVDAENAARASDEGTSLLDGFHDRKRFLSFHVGDKKYLRCTGVGDWVPMQKQRDILIKAKRLLSKTVALNDWEDMTDAERKADPQFFEKREKLRKLCEAQVGKTGAHMRMDQTTIPKEILFFLRDHPIMKAKQEKRLKAEKLSELQVRQRATAKAATLEKEKLLAQAESMAKAAADAQ